MEQEPIHIFRFVLHSNLNNVHRVSTFLKKVNKIAQLSEDDFYRLLISATEAVNNAIIHGNNRDENKRVEIVCELKKTVLILSVSDEGKGFDLKKIPNPLKKKNKMKTGGRGIFLMQTLVDSVENKKTENGSVTVLKMKLG